MFIIKILKKLISVIIFLNHIFMLFNILMHVLFKGLKVYIFANFNLCVIKFLSFFLIY